MSFGHVSSAKRRHCWKAVLVVDTTSLGGAGGLLIWINARLEYPLGVKLMAPIGLPLLSFSRELNFCREQLAQVLVKLSDRIGISTEKRKMAIDGLNRPELGTGN